MAAERCSCVESLGCKPSLKRLTEVVRSVNNNFFLSDSSKSALQFRAVQFSHSVVSDYVRPHGPQHARPPCLITNPWSLLKLMTIESVMPSNHLILCRPLLFLPSIFPSITVFSNESTLRIRWPKCGRFNFMIRPSKEHPGLISLGWTGWISLQSKGLSGVFSNTTVQKHQFSGTQLSSQSNSHIHT